MSIFRKLLGLCVHTWADVGQVRGSLDPKRGGMVCRCSKCGEYRTFWH